MSLQMSTRIRFLRNPGTVSLENKAIWNGCSCAAHGPLNGQGLRSARASLYLHRRVARHLVHAADHCGAVQTSSPGPDRRAVPGARLDRSGLARGPRHRRGRGDQGHPAYTGGPGAARGNAGGRGLRGGDAESAAPVGLARRCRDGARARTVTPVGPVPRVTPVGPVSRVGAADSAPRESPVAPGDPAPRADPGPAASVVAGQSALTPPKLPFRPSHPAGQGSFSRTRLSASVALRPVIPVPQTLGENSMDRQVKYVLQESEMPREWYNVIADLPSPPPPPLHPGTREPVGRDDLAPLFPAALIAQEVSPDRYIAIPDEVVDVYRLWRPTPLFRARRLEKDLGTPARIYYKYEGGSPAGSHKP